MTLPVHVYPALRVRIVRHRGRAVARVSGGDGAVVAYRWTIGAHGRAFTPSVHAPQGTRLSVTVSDAAGGVARSGATRSRGSGACAASRRVVRQPPQRRRGFTG